MFLLHIFVFWLNQSDYNRKRKCPPSSLYLCLCTQCCFIRNDGTYRGTAAGELCSHCGPSQRFLWGVYDFHTWKQVSWWIGGGEWGYRLETKKFVSYYFTLEIYCYCYVLLLFIKKLSSYFHIFYRIFFFLIAVEWTLFFTE